MFSEQNGINIFMIFRRFYIILIGSIANMIATSHDIFIKKK